MGLQGIITDPKTGLEETCAVVWDIIPPDGKISSYWIRVKIIRDNGHVFASGAIPYDDPEADAAEWCKSKGVRLGGTTVNRRILKAPQVTEEKKHTFVLRLEDKLNEAFGGQFATIGGKKYSIAGMDAQGRRQLSGPGGPVGYIDAEGNVQVSGPSFDDEETAKPQRGGPKKSGWEVEWQGTDGMKAGKFFPKNEGMDECPMCKGAGKVPGSGANRCKQCAGTGKVVGATGAASKCPACKGRGSTPDVINPKGEKCQGCFGMGVQNPRLQEFVKALRSAGRGPVVKIARGESQYMSAKE
jgi:hypothetical protein